jgi:hypothetical protein
MRPRTRAALLVIAVALLTAPPMAPTPAAAQDPSTTNTTYPVPEGAVQIGDGYSFTEATVMSPDGTTREMDAYDAAVFVQSWLGQAFFGGEEIVREPPGDLPVHRVDVEGAWAGPIGRLTVYYASDGTTPYIAFPQDQQVVTDPNAPPPEPSNWFVAPPRAIDAFNGDAELIETTGVQQITQVPPEEQAAGESSDDDTPWAWIAVVAGVVVLLGGGLIVRSVRSR